MRVVASGRRKGPDCLSPQASTPDLPLLKGGVLPLRYAVPFLLLYCCMDAMSELLLFGTATATAHNRHLPARLPLPRIYLKPIRHSLPELTLRELINNSSTKIGCFTAVFRVSENEKAREPKGCR